MSTSPTNTCSFHPSRATGLACTRCGRPACPDCLSPAPVGAHCTACVKAAMPTFGETATRQVRSLRAVRPSPIFGLLVLVMIGSAVFLHGAHSESRAKAGTFFFVASGWVVSLCLHEFGHALVAYLGGDASVRSKGYLTLDPRRYTDPVLSLVMPLMFVLLGGIGLPGGAVWINRGAIRNPRTQTMVSLAGPAANIVMAVLCLLPFRLGFQTVGSPLWPALAFLGHLQIIAAVINLLPIPGLDGFGAIEPHLSAKTLASVAPFRQYGFVILFLLLWTPTPVRDFVFSVSEHVSATFIGDAARAARLHAIGYTLFRFWEP